VQRHPRTYQFAGEQQIYIDPGRSLHATVSMTPRSCIRKSLSPSYKQIYVSESQRPSKKTTIPTSH